MSLIHPVEDNLYLDVFFQWLLLVSMMAFIQWAKQSTFVSSEIAFPTCGATFLYMIWAQRAVEAECSRAFMSNLCWKFTYQYQFTEKRLVENVKGGEEKQQNRCQV